MFWPRLPDDGPADERAIKRAIFDRYPDLINMRPLGWRGGLEVPMGSRVGVAVVPRLRFDGWYQLPVRDDELRDRVRAWLREHQRDRVNCPDHDAVLVLARLA